jgi:hypothetical protein
VVRSSVPASCIRFANYFALAIHMGCELCLLKLRSSDLGSHPAAVAKPADATLAFAVGLAYPMAGEDKRSRGNPSACLIRLFVVDYAYAG